MNNTWIFASLAAASGIILSTWQTLKNLVFQFRSVFIEEHEVSGERLVWTLRQEFAQHWHRVGFVPYVASLVLWSKHANQPRWRLVTAEDFSGVRLYRQGWTYVWVDWGQKSGQCNLYGLRRICNFPEILKVATESLRSSPTISSSFYVSNVTGSAGHTLVGDNHGPSGIFPDLKRPSDRGMEDYAPHYDASVFLQAVARGVAWFSDGENHEVTDVDSDCQSGQAFRGFALSSQMQEAVQEFKRWMNSTQFYEERGIPWKRGWLLSGEPGNGKTSFVRALARQFEVPIYAMQLATLRNKELLGNWQSCASPCIILLEDLDCVFLGRENVTGVSDSVNFECLLNCMDGIEVGYGRFVIATSNHPERLDPALRFRPGRIDRELIFTPPDKQGQETIAKRILGPWPALVQRVLDEQPDGVSGAVFAQACRELAEQHYWSDPPSASDSPSHAECVANILALPD